MIAQEGAPTLTRRVAFLGHVLGHRRLSHRKTELEQLAMNVRRTPKPIVYAHPPDQRQGEPGGQLEGALVTIDAMGCQVGIADKIVAHKADYLLALKGNQATLETDVEDYFRTAPAAKLVSKTTVEKGQQPPLVAFVLRLRWAARRSPLLQSLSPDLGGHPAHSG
jgi:hypothetical protein